MVHSHRFNIHQKLSQPLVVNLSKSLKGGFVLLICVIFLNPGQNTLQADV